MKKLLCIVCASMIAVSLAGCAGGGETVEETALETVATSEVLQTAETVPVAESTQDTAPEEARSTATEVKASQEKWDTNPYAYFERFNIVLDESKNYKLLTDTDKTGYQYYVYDNYGEIIDSGYHDYRGCQFSLRDGYLVYYNGGFSITWYERYYDLENGRVSRFFLRPLDTHENLVAYYKVNSEGKTVLVVCDMFDNQTYYQEFQRDFEPSVHYGGSTGSFSEDGKTFTVTYTVTDHEAKKDTEITETLQLPTA